MDRVVFESVRKVFRHRPALFNWLGRERSGETVALKDLSFAAGAGEVLVLLGPNGSGKTTALKLVSTTLLPDAGSIHVSALDTQRDGGRIRQQVGIAIATERSFFPRLSARENLEFFAALDDVEFAVVAEGGLYFARARIGARARRKSDRHGRARGGQRADAEGDQQESD